MKPNEDIFIGRLTKPNLEEGQDRVMFRYSTLENIFKKKNSPVWIEIEVLTRKFLKNYFGLFRIRLCSFHRIRF